MNGNKKILLKTISWRIVATSMSMVFIYFFSGQVVLAAGVGAFEVVVRTSLYFLHEKFWNRIS
ncbi:MAG: DUF2061 domain-containing protein [Candidatus Thorarchaeota archaeon]|nr:MAG: DUF2061 domain-containing protein [Candidatus Thorarchaeota archaeon]